MAKNLPDQLIDTHLRVESCKKESHDVLTIEIRSVEIRADVQLDVQSDVKRIWFRVFQLAITMHQQSLTHYRIAPSTNIAFSSVSTLHVLIQSICFAE